MNACTEQEKIKLISQGILIECPSCKVNLIGNKTIGDRNKYTHEFKQIFVISSGTYPDHYRCPFCNSEWQLNEWTKFFAVTDVDKHICYLNPSLIIKQKLDFNKIALIKKLHVLKSRVFEIMENSVTKSALKNGADTVTQIEFMLQEAWGFTKDKNFHCWFEVPKCTCPKMDNRERQGTEYTIISGNCPVHGE